jgi:hypothetical protein
MNRVYVVNGQICFNLAFTFEMAVLTRGPEEARAAMRDAAAQVQDEEARRAMLETADSPVLIPLTQEDKYRRVYAFAVELGRGIGEKISGESLLERLRMAFGEGFVSAAGIPTPRFDGADGLCFGCGELVGNLVVSLFPEDDDPDFRPPDFEEITERFLEGVVLGQADQD